MKSPKYLPEHVEALQVLEASLKKHGYRAAPFQLQGGLCKNPERAHGVVFFHHEGQIELVNREEGDGMPELHNIQINLYLGPPKQNEPTIHVFHIDHYGVGMDGGLTRPMHARLGIPNLIKILDNDKQPRYSMDYRARATTTPWNTDLYVLPHELVAFAEWLPNWVDYMEHDKPYVPGPYPLEGRQELWHEAWSQAAMAAYRAWEKIIEAVRSGSRPPVSEMS